MLSWLCRRIGLALLTVLIVMTLSFTAVHLAPGTPFMPRGDRPAFDAPTVARLQARFGLDRPVPEQFVRYLGALAHGELGESFSQHRPVARLLAEAIPRSLLLTGTALGIEFGLGLSLGIFQAVFLNRRRDRFLGTITLIWFSVPTFWLGLVLLLVFGQWLHWFPVGGMVDPAIYESLSPIGQLLDRVHHLVLPALTIGLVGAAGTARFQRSATIAAINQDFTRVARSKGLGASQILWRHTVPNALLPGITLMGLALPFLLTGAVVVETVFAWPGMGKLAADAVATRDYPVVMATTLLASVVVVFGSLVADLLYGVIDPRVREGAYS